MNVTFQLDDSELDVSRQLWIQEALHFGPGDLEPSLSRLCKAAALEYIAMFVGSGMPSRADEIRQDRLYFLIRHFYRTRLPGEPEVAAIFQLTPAQSRSLLRSTCARYRTRLGGPIRPCRPGRPFCRPTTT